MAMITIEIDDRQVLDVLQELARKVDHLEPVMRAIGEDLVDSTLRRFATSTAPDGSRWAPNSEVTILQYLEGRSGVYGKKSGKLTQKGAGAVTGKKPLIGDTRNLSTTISYQVVDGGRTLLIGSPQKYAAVQQFGATAHEFGKAPWGDIPARPFLGISETDQRSILDTMRNFFGPSG